MRVTYIPYTTYAYQVHEVYEVYMCTCLWLQQLLRAHPTCLSYLCILNPHVPPAHVYILYVHCIYACVLIVVYMVDIDTYGR